jgi:hypothetical protein
LKGQATPSILNINWEHKRMGMIILCKLMKIEIISQRIESGIWTPEWA